MSLYSQFHVSILPVQCCHSPSPIFRYSCTIRHDLPVPTDWPLIVDDGLLDANQLLRSGCDTCHMFLQRDSRSALIPKLLNVMIVSVQPERNVQLYPTAGQLTLCVHAAHIWGGFHPSQYIAEWDGNWVPYANSHRQTNLCG